MLHFWIANISCHNPSLEIMEHAANDTLKKGACLSPVTLGKMFLIRYLVPLP